MERSLRLQGLGWSRAGLGQLTSPPLDSQQQCVVGSGGSAWSGSKALEHASEERKESASFWKRQIRGGC